MSINSIAWSAQKEFFYAPDSLAVRKRLYVFFRSKGYYVDYNDLKTKKRHTTHEGATFKRQEKTQGNSNSFPCDNNEPRDSNIPGSSRRNSRSGRNPRNRQKGRKHEMYMALSLELREMLKNYADHLRGKRLSQSTVSVYGYFILRFLDFAKTWEQPSWSNKTIDLFLEHVIAKEDYSISSHRQCISALKYFTALFELTDFDASQLNRPKKSRILPVVLSKEEVIDLLQATRNLKHRTILALIYSSGLRIGELLNLKIKDIDLDRNQVFVRQSKGRKDRTVILSEVIRPLLLNYLSTYRPKIYVIEGQNGGRYSSTSIRTFLKRSCKHAGISKHITPHTLRHSFATHMMENGVSLRHIQSLLGHSKPETTMIYTHVVQKDLLRIKSPLDTAVEALTKSENNPQKVLLSRNFKG